MLPSWHNTLPPPHPACHLLRPGTSPDRRGARAPAWPCVLAIAALALADAVPGSASETPLPPYIPTTVLVPASGAGNSTTAYVFSPARGSVDLLSLDLSASTGGAVSTRTSGLPFVSSSSKTTTFTANLASDGSLVVFAGDCASDAGSSVWIYNTTSSQPSWKHHPVTSSDGTTGPYFLGSSMAFSETLSPSVSTPHIYAYGGQCPDSSVNGTTWIDAAAYSHAMVRLTPSSDGYEAATLSIKSQPIAEAGFTLTPLLPSTSNVSGAVTQDINGVVLGGHTRAAFVNMSTAAVWALPEASWSFLSIAGPASTASSESSELANNDGKAVQVQSRSGHTAVLSEDGTKLVILGGWVGDTGQAAEPQLAVLDMSEDEYGEWAWSVPREQPLADGHGIYGHGAALLPGNVMVVAGGYAIASSPTSLAPRLGRRDNMGVAGGQLPMFFNLTSLTWADSYTNPSRSGSDPASPTNAYVLGLGLGLGGGIPLALVFMAITIFCVRRSRNNRHRNRDDHARNLTGGAAFITSEEMLEAEHEHVYPWGPRTASGYYHGLPGGHYPGGHDPYMREDQYENLRGQHGLDQDNGASGSAAGYRGSVRRNTSLQVAKGLYQPTGVDESRAMAVVSPILEDEEDELSTHGAISPDQDMEGNEYDPFVPPMASAMLGTPPRPLYPTPGERSTIVFVAPSPSPDPTAPVSPSEPYTPTRTAPPQSPEVQNWVTDVDVSDALISQRLQPNVGPIRAFGRGSGSPTRRQSVRFSFDDGRTPSDLSDRSVFSFAPVRADSLRAGGPLTPSLPAPHHAADPASTHRGGTAHSDQSGRSSSSSGATNSSFRTARSMAPLQLERPGLLVLGRPRPISAIENVADEDWDGGGGGGGGGESGSPSKSKAPRRSWFGSLRRVFSNSGGGGSSSSGTSSVHTESPAHGDSSDYERLDLGGLGLGGVGAGMLQKRKQGRSAWADGAGAAAVGAEAASSSLPHGEESDEEEWDIERAVEQRLVQVMFSVPKERLRIVNAEPDIISIEESVAMVEAGTGDEGEEGEEGEEEEEDDLSPILEKSAMDKGKGTERAEGEQASATHLLALPPQEPEIHQQQPQRRLEDDEANTATWDKGKQRESLELAASSNSSNDERREPGKRPKLLQVPWMSGSPASPTRDFSPGVPMMAEAIRFERPPSTPRSRSRVQEMVDSLEQRSRSNSPVKDRLSKSSGAS